MAKGVSKKMSEELTIAYKTELTGYAFYTYAADVIGGEKGKNIFKHIAKEELEHIAVVSTIAESLEAGRGILSYADALKAGSSALEHKGLPIFPKKNELIDRLKTNATDQGAVEIAVEAEEQAVEFYGNMLHYAVTPDEKMLLTQLLEMEKGHLKLFRWELESLIKTGFWCDVMEYSVEKEI